MFGELQDEDETEGSEGLQLRGLSSCAEGRPGVERLLQPLGQHAQRRGCTLGSAREHLLCLRT